MASNSSKSIEKKPKLIPATEWESREGYPTTSGLRWLIFHERTNGFHKCVRRIGRRVLIDREKFYEWVEEQNNVGGDSNA